ncbi:hypothetical protein GCM10022240_23260 [Microbacterium kribbense]|uniref:Uncharacterized protein n=1 Tax=Microbacterium kribbense TaxID=433645 RepID=A0ABP7GPP3_9MICO
MTAMTTRAVPTRQWFAPPTFTERMLLAAAGALEASARRRMLRRRALVERVAAGGLDPVQQRGRYAIDAYRRLHLR